MRVEGRYDVRKGAAGYAPIIGTFGALAVPAIIVLFTVPHQPNAHRAPYIALAAGLLIVGMIGSLTGSLGMAGIAAEEDNTANLPPAIMLTGIPVLISLVTILAAFEVLAAFYLPDSKSLFAIITGVTGLLGSFFIAYTIGDSWHSGPTDPYDRDLWLPHQWIKSHKDAYAWADKVAIAGALPVAVGIILRSSGIHVAPSTITVDWLVGAGLAIIVMGFFLGVRRTGHPPDGYQRGVRKPEAFAITIIPSLYILALLIFLP